MSIDLRFYVSLFMRRIHYFLIILALGSAIGITLATVLPPVYILTRDSLLEMANRLRIYEGRPGEIVERIPADEIVEDLRERITIRTTGGSGARGPVQATIVEVSFEAPTAVMSATVTNEVVTLILQENVEIRTSALIFWRFRNAIWKRCQIVLIFAANSNRPPKSDWRRWNVMRRFCATGVIG